MSFREVKQDIWLTILLHAAAFSLVLCSWCLVFSFQARAVSSHVQHITLKCSDAVLPACIRVWLETVMLGSSMPGTHINFAVSFIIFMEQGKESPWNSHLLCRGEVCQVFSLPPLELCGWQLQLSAGALPQDATV